VKAVDAGMLLVVNVTFVLMTGRAEAASLRPFSSPTLETVPAVRSLLPGSVAPLPREKPVIAMPVFELLSLTSVW